MQSNQSDVSMLLRHMHHPARAHHLNARQNQSSAHSARATPFPPSGPPTSYGREAATLMAAIPVCLLLAHVLAFPSDYIGEPCMVPVSCVTTAKLSPPGSSMSATNRGLYKGLYLHFPDVTQELVVSLELNCVY